MKPEQMQAIGLRVDTVDYRATLTRLGLTIIEAADVIGVDHQTSRKWWHGKRHVPLPVQRVLWACERDRTLLEIFRAAG